MVTHGCMFDAASRGGETGPLTALADSFCFSSPSLRQPASSQSPALLLLLFFPFFFFPIVAMSGGDERRHLQTTMPAPGQSAVSPAASPSAAAAAAAHRSFVQSRRLGDLVDVADPAGVWTGNDASTSTGTGTGTGVHGETTRDENTIVDPGAPLWSSVCLSLSPSVLQSAKCLRWTPKHWRSRLSVPTRP